MNGSEHVCWPNPLRDSNPCSAQGAESDGQAAPLTLGSTRRGFASAEPGVYAVIAVAISLGGDELVSVAGQNLHGANFRMRGILPIRRALQQRVAAIVRDNSQHRRSNLLRHAIEAELIQKPGQMISDRLVLDKDRLRASSMRNKP